MKIVFFTEGNYRGKVDRSVAGRTDTAWIAALNADHCPLLSTPLSGYDLGIIIPPKNFDRQFVDIIDYHRPHCVTLASMQEGDARLFWQDRPIWQQIDYIDFLTECDILYCHNDIDQRYFSGLTQHEDVRILPTVMIEDAIPKNKLCSIESRYGAMLNGNWVSWYGGADSFFVAQEFEEPIFAPEMGRMCPEERDLVEIRHIPYSNWGNWMIELSKRKYAVNLMRTIAAASFSLNAAWLSIPCVGWDVQDTQRLCFPELSVPLGDMAAARKRAKSLKQNQLFYNHCAAYAKKMAIDIYGEERFVEKFYEDFKDR